jgi:hypothetical protein
VELERLHTCAGTRNHVKEDRMKAPRTGMSVLCCIVGLMSAACSSDAADGGGGGAGSAAKGSGPTGGGAADCNARCSAIANQCMQPPDSCAQLCTKVTDSQLSCIEASHCNGDKVQACLESSTTGTSMGNTTTASGNSSSAGGLATCIPDSSHDYKCQGAPGLAPDFVACPPMKIPPSGWNCTNAGQSPTDGWCCDCKEGCK